MPLLSEIARITGGRIFTKDAAGVRVVPSNKGFFISNENHAVYNPETKKWVNASDDKAEFYFSSRAEAEKVAETVDSILTDLVGFAKKIGEELMEPTEKAAAGDTKDGEEPSEAKKKLYKTAIYEGKPVSLKKYHPYGNYYEIELISGEGRNAQVAELSNFVL